MELVGRSNRGNRGNGSCQGERGGGCNRKGSSHWSWGNGGRDGVDNMVQDGGGDIVDKGNWKTEDWSCRNLIISFNGFSFSLLHTGSSSSGFSMSSKVFSSSSSNFRCLLRGNRGHQGGSSWGHRGNRESSWGSLRGHRDVGTSHSESIDIISNVVDSLENSIGIHILIASSGHSKGILGLSLGTMDILVSKAELSKLILGMELVGRSHWSNRGNGSCQRERGGGSSKGSRSREDRLRSRDRSWDKGELFRSKHL